MQASGIGFESVERDPSGEFEIAITNASCFDTEGVGAHEGAAVIEIATGQHGYRFAFVTHDAARVIGGRTDVAVDTQGQVACGRNWLGAGNVRAFPEQHHHTHHYDDNL